MQHCYCTVRFIIYNTDVNECKYGERIWHRQDFNSALTVQQVVMLLLFRRSMKILYGAKNDVHAFSYNSAESEPIWTISAISRRTNFTTFKHNYVDR